MRLFLACAVCLAWTGATLAQTRHLSADDLPRIVRLADPQIAPDGKTVALLVGRANLKEDRWDNEVDFVDVATKQLRVMTRGRQGVSWIRWSPSGDRLAFLAEDRDKHVQLWILPVQGGEALQITHSKTPVRQFTWRPDGRALAFAAADEVPEKKDEAKFEDAFEVGNNSYLERAAAAPVHLWTVELGDDGTGKEKRLTSGTWSLPVHAAPAGPPSEICYTPDGTRLIFESRVAHHRRLRIEQAGIAAGCVRRNRTVDPFYDRGK